ncbi:DNA alkylation repair protein [Tessaracoccus oleiagri]|uniref:3-methyladenine DNA glycosylase AlkD n=1 Tax=Tessaracoccus oleiagri TaxID=686624 RepID=A0A1G9HRK5_9ACTN|nr:DNA alkylation repair protein [Tessaracoccus oleiagri]SDL15570.1 3-methyladenine DNA glycosylase AlkD [Tessaracoccus oleiagri]
MDPDEGLVTQLRLALAAAGDPERAAQQRRYMRSPLPFHGVGRSELDVLLRQLLSEHALTTRDRWDATVRELWFGATHREERYAALVVAAHRSARPWQDVDTLALYRELITDGAWWDLVDEIATRLVGPILRGQRDQATPIIDAWAVSGDLWLRRAAILSQLKHRADTDAELLARCLVANLEPTRFGREFFIRKAVGWALREYSKTDAGWVRGFLVAHDEELSGLSRREASKYL